MSKYVKDLLDEIEFDTDTGLFLKDSPQNYRIRAKNTSLSKATVAWYKHYNEIPNHMVYRIDKLSGYTKDNLSKTPPFTRRTKKSKTGIKGVSIKKDGYQASIVLDRKLYSLGKYSNAHEAHIAYQYALYTNTPLKFYGRYKTNGISISDAELILKSKGIL